MDKLIFNIIESSTEDYILYRYRDWLWLINPKTEKWVASVSDSGYMFYNYEFFSNLFKYVSLNCMTDKKYIKSWAMKRMGVSVGEHCYVDYDPTDYDWRDQFDVKEVIERCEPITSV